MSYSKDHSRKNPLSPSRMYGMNSSANTNTTPIDNQPTVTTEKVARDGQAGILTTTTTKPRKSKLPVVSMEEAYDRALKLGYRDKDESFEDYAIRANKFNEGEVKEEFKPETKLMKSRGIKPIDLPDPVRTIQSVPFTEPIIEEEKLTEEEEDPTPEKPNKSFNLGKLKPKINIGNPFIKNTITNRKGQFKSKGRSKRRNFQGKLKIFNR